MSRSAVFLVQLSRPSASTVSVHYTTVAGTATASSDFTPVSGTITFAPGQTSAQVVVPIVEPLDGEPEEKFTLALSSPVNATLANTTGYCTIPAKNPSEFPVVSINDQSGSTITFTVTLSQAHTVASSISYSTQSRTAIAGQDFTATSGTLNFAAGENSKTISVPILAKSDRELSFKLLLTNPNKLTLYRLKTGVGTITVDAGVVTKVNAAKAAKTAYETAVKEAADAKTALDKAWSEWDTADKAYQTAVGDTSVAKANLDAANANVPSMQTQLAGFQLAAVLYPSSTNTALVLAAQGNLSSAIEKRDAAQTTYNTAVSTEATKLGEKNTKYTTYQSADTTNTTKQNAVTTTKVTAETTKATAEAAFVGSTKLVL